MMRDPLTLLAYERKKKPIINEVMEKIEAGVITKAEIEATPVQLKWMTAALIQFYEKKMFELRQSNSWQFISQSTSNDNFYGTIMRWDQETSFIQTGTVVGKRNKEVMVSEGDILFFTENGFYYGDVYYTDCGNIKDYKLTLIGNKTRDEYRKMYQNCLEKKI